MDIRQVREKFKGAYVRSYEKAQKNYDNKYMSHHHNEDTPLVCQELNVLTVEDYDKWYGLYYLMEDPDTKEIMLVTLCHGDILEGIDHEYYPDSVIKFCIENNLIIDPVSFLCINKSLLFYDEKILETHLANLLDICNCQLESKQAVKSKSYAFYLDGRYDTVNAYYIERLLYL